MSSELTLDPVVPRFKTVNGKKLFNRGHTPVIKGKTLEEYHGSEKAREIRRKMRESHLGHPYYGGCEKSRAKAVVIINGGELIGRFSSIKVASQKAGVSYDCAKGYVRKKYKPKNGWLWFLENDPEWYDHVTK